MKDNTFLENRDGGFYISYNPNTKPTETALVQGYLNQSFGRVYYILYGNHLEQYEALLNKGYDACYDYFKSQPQNTVSIWSE